MRQLRKGNDNFCKDMNPETTSNRAEASWTSSFNVVAGIWLIISPFVLLYANSTAQINEIVVGAVITLFGIIRALVPGAGTTWLSWLNALWGIWLIVASFILGNAGVARPTKSFSALSSWFSASGVR
jgi:hypothetical protein